MENINEINRRIANNLMCYRKSAGLTQAELANKINYSDKSVSKWEQGNGMPDIYILMQLAELYGVTLNDLVGADGEQVAKRAKKKTRALHVFIMLLSSGIIWLVATCAFVMLGLFAPALPAWLAFLYALPLNAILLVVYASVWKYRGLNFIAISGIIWSVLTCVFVTGIKVGYTAGNLWLLFLIGAPLQVLEIFWASFRMWVKNRIGKITNKEKRVKKEK